MTVNANLEVECNTVKTLRRCLFLERRKRHLHLLLRSGAFAGHARLVVVLRDLPADDTHDHLPRQLARRATVSCALDANNELRDLAA